MTPHRRTEIRNLVVARLVSALTIAGGQVFPGRYQPAHEEELEAGGVIFVYTLEEKIPADPEGYPYSNTRAGLRRDLTIVVDAVVPAFIDDTADTADYDRDAFARADTIAAEIENALETYDPPGFDSSLLRLRASKLEISAVEGGLPVGKATMTYEFTYTTPYRTCSDPLVNNDSENIYLRGLYPGGQVIEGCPADNSGEACPILDATVIADGDPLSLESLPFGSQA